MFQRFFKIAIILGALAAPIGFMCVWFSDRPTNSTSEIERAKACIEPFISQVVTRIRTSGEPGKTYVLSDSQRSFLDRCLTPLSYHNSGIAKAKFITQTGVLIDKWETRTPDLMESYRATAGRPWAAQEAPEIVLQAIAIAALSSASTFCIVLMVLFFLRWSWLFLLDRIRELSGAVRGK